MTRAHLDKRPSDVSAMFDAVAPRYDLLNDVLSLGQDHWWRRVVAQTVAAEPNERVLDIAAGTGTSSRTFTASGASCVACDFSLGMLQEGARRQRKRGGGAERADAAHGGAERADPAAAAAASGPATGPLRFVAGDALRLPFADGSFDAVTISFGLRNVVDTDAALRELRRVSKPGGRLVVCEFSHLRWPRLDALYVRYLAAALPSVARRLSRAGDAYEYLAESIRDWPTAPDLATMIAAAGWTKVRYRPLSTGVVAVHAARRPA